MIIFSNILKIHRLWCVFMRCHNFFSPCNKWSQNPSSEFSNDFQFYGFVGVCLYSWKIGNNFFLKWSIHWSSRIREQYTGACEKRKNALHRPWVRFEGEERVKIHKKKKINHHEADVKPKSYRAPKILGCCEYIYIYIIIGVQYIIRDIRRIFDFVWFFLVSSCEILNYKSLNTVKDNCNNWVV